MERRLGHAEFADLLLRIAGAWAACDADEAAGCSTDDAVYMEPPDRQLFVGQMQIRNYFTPLRPGTCLDLH